MTDVEALEQDIEQTRQRLDHTFDQLQSRFTVMGTTDEMLGLLNRTPLKNVSETIQDNLKNNPLPILMVAAGLSWFFYKLRNSQKVKENFHGY